MVKIISPISQREVEAVEVDFDAKSEPWATYELSDGSTIKLRTIVSGVARLEGEHDGMGNPVYTVNHNTIIRIVNAPKNLKGAPGTIGPPRGKSTTGGPEVR